MARKNKRSGDKPPEAHDQSAASTDEDQQIQFDNPGEKYGFTADGVRFEVPKTLDTVATFLPQNLSFFGVVTLGFCCSTIYAALCLELPRWKHIVWFLFWRCSYNIGIGTLLTLQSKHKWITKKFISLTKDRSSFVSKTLFRFARAGVANRNFRCEDYPPEYNSWLLFRHLVNLVLINDVCAYLALGYKSFFLPKQFTALVLLQYVAGVFLCVFNYWAKVDAHRCIGEYCWYWGDFFYLKRLNLKFDGIFELFPHPMYTVGYSLYYGYTLIVRSYTMLFVSITAHLLQLVFLVLVEEPHIKRTYPEEEKQFDANKYRQLYDSKSGLFPRGGDSIFLFRLSIFNAGDVCLVLLVGYNIFLSFSLSRDFVVGQVIFWTCFQWLGLGSILWLQSSWKLWSRYFEDRGRSLHESFAQWKLLYNTTMTMRVVAFGCCFVRVLELRVQDLLDPAVWARLVLGVLLIALTVWTLKSTYDTVGDFGWFFGDFFIERDAFEQHLCYTGIYRFLNNPDCVTGYAAWYGCALISHSWTIFFLALMSQIMNVIFLESVEIPHMKKLYGEMRQTDPFRKTFRKIRTKVMSPLPSKVREKQSYWREAIRDEVRKIRLKALQEVYTLYRTVAKRRRRASEDRTSEIETELRAPETHLIGTPLQIQLTTQPGHSEYDWLGIYEPHRPSQPGMSDGAWMYIGTTKPVTSVTFHPVLLPKRPGLYEVRYHLNNKYNVVSRRFIQLITEDQQADKSGDTEVHDDDHGDHGDHGDHDHAHHHADSTNTNTNTITSTTNNNNKNGNSRKTKNSSEEQVEQKVLDAENKKRKKSSNNNTGRKTAVSHRA